MPINYYRNLRLWMAGASVTRASLGSLRKLIARTMVTFRNSHALLVKEVNSLSRRIKLWLEAVVADVQVKPFRSNDFIDQNYIMYLY